MRPAEHRFPLCNNFPLESVVNSCYPEDVDRSHTHFEEGLDRLYCTGHGLKRGHFSVCQFVL
jgi:hypothetical protein